MSFYDEPLEWPEDEEEERDPAPRVAEVFGDERALLMDESARAPEPSL